MQDYALWTGPFDDITLTDDEYPPGVEDCRLRKGEQQDIVSSPSASHVWVIGALVLADLVTTAGICQFVAHCQCK